MNKRQLKKTVMRNVSKLYDVAFEQGRFRKDVAIICGMGPMFRRTLTTVVIKQSRYEWSFGELLEISLEGYVTDQKTIERGTHGRYIPMRRTDSRAISTVSR